MKQLRAVLVILVLFVLVFPAIRRWDRAERAAEREARRLKPNPWQVKYEARVAAAESTKAAKTPEELKAIFAGFDEDTTEHVVHSDELRDAFSAWYAEGMRLALEMSEALPERKRYFVFRWGEAFYQKDPGLFLECARKYLDTLHEHDVSLNIFQELGETDVEKGLELLPDVKARQIRETVVPVFYGAWAQRDAAKARESARTLESARDRKIAEDAIARVR